MPITPLTRATSVHRHRTAIASLLAAGAIGGIASEAAASERTMVAILTGSQQNPAVDTQAEGCARIIVDTVNNTLSYRIAFSGLGSPETAAHFHGPADPGMNAGVLEPLPAGNPKVGVWSYPEANEADILGGRIYINIHTGANPGGELRGQVVDMVARLDGEQENPPVATAGHGFGLFMIDTLDNALDYHIVFDDLSASESAAHIHGFALHGTNVGVQHPLPAGSPKVGSWSYPESAEEAILGGRTYVNIHSSAHPGGELRGQITRHVNPLDGDQEVPPSGVTGHGCGFVAIDEGADTLSYHLRYQNLTGPATAAHIHGYAPPGVNAGVVHGIGTANPSIGTWTYGAANEADVLDGLTYFNVHTAAHPGGEVRGQLMFAGTPCPQDLDCNGEVGFGDLLAVLSTWGPCPGCIEDLDGDGSVGFSDLLEVLSSWGPCPG